MEPRNDVAVAKRKAVSEALAKARHWSGEGGAGAGEGCWDLCENPGAPRHRRALSPHRSPPPLVDVQTGPDGEGQYEGDFAASDQAKAAGSKALAEGNLDEAEALYTQALMRGPGTRQQGTIAL